MKKNDIIKINMLLIFLLFSKLVSKIDFRDFKFHNGTLVLCYKTKLSKDFEDSEDSASLLEGLTMEKFKVEIIKFCKRLEKDLEVKQLCEDLSNAEKIYDDKSRYAEKVRKLDIFCILCYNIVEGFFQDLKSELENNKIFKGISFENLASFFLNLFFSFMEDKIMHFENDVQIKIMDYICSKFSFEFLNIKDDIVENKGLKIEINNSQLKDIFRNKFAFFKAQKLAKRKETIKEMINPYIEQIERRLFRVASYNLEDLDFFNQYLCNCLKTLRQYLNEINRMENEEQITNFVREIKLFKFINELKEKLGKEDNQNEADLSDNNQAQPATGYSQVQLAMHQDNEAQPATDEAENELLQKFVEKILTLTLERINNFSKSLEELEKLSQFKKNEISKQLKCLQDLKNYINEKFATKESLTNEEIKSFLEESEKKFSHIEMVMEKTKENLRIKVQQTIENEENIERNRIKNEEKQAFRQIIIEKEEDQKRIKVKNEEANAFACLSKKLLALKTQLTKKEALENANKNARDKVEKTEKDAREKLFESENKNFSQLSKLKIIEQESFARNNVKNEEEKGFLAIQTFCIKQNLAQLKSEVENCLNIYKEMLTRFITQETFENFKILEKLTRELEAQMNNEEIWNGEKMNEIIEQIKNVSQQLSKIKQFQAQPVGGKLKIIFDGILNQFRANVEFYKKEVKALRDQRYVPFYNNRAGINGEEYAFNNMIIQLNSFFGSQFYFSLF